MKISYLLFIMFLFWLVIGGIFVHEFTHYFQFDEETNKRICFLGKNSPFAYLYTEDVVYYFTKEEKYLNEIEANIFALGFWILNIFWFITNTKLFVKR